ncbi:MAG: hypothetical protein ACE365_08210 [Gammaproteobacteria bacterium]
MANRHWYHPNNGKEFRDVDTVLWGTLHLKRDAGGTLIQLKDGSWVTYNGLYKFPSESFENARGDLNEYVQENISTDPYSLKWQIYSSNDTFTLRCIAGPDDPTPDHTFTYDIECKVFRPLRHGEFNPFEETAEGIYDNIPDLFDLWKAWQEDTDKGIHHQEISGVDYICPNGELYIYMNGFYYELNDEKLTRGERVFDVELITLLNTDSTLQSKLTPNLKAIDENVSQAISKIERDIQNVEKNSRLPSWFRDNTKEALKQRFIEEYTQLCERYFETLNELSNIGIHILNHVDTAPITITPIAMDSEDYEKKKKFIESLTAFLVKYQQEFTMLANKIDNSEEKIFDELTSDIKNKLTAIKHTITTLQASLAGIYTYNPEANKLPKGITCYAEDTRGNRRPIDNPQKLNALSEGQSIYVPSGGGLELVYKKTAAGTKFTSVTGGYSLASIQRQFDINKEKGNSSVWISGGDSETRFRALFLARFQGINAYCLQPICLKTIEGTIDNSANCFFDQMTIDLDTLELLLDQHALQYEQAYGKSRSLLFFGDHVKTLNIAGVIYEMSLENPEISQALVKLRTDAGLITQFKQQAQDGKLKLVEFIRDTSTTYQLNQHRDIELDITHRPPA